MESLHTRLLEIESLPLLPEVVNRVNELILNDEGSGRELAELIEQDAALASKTLSLANSSFYNYSGRRITKLEEAVVRIGREELFSMLFTTSVIKAFPPGTEVIDYQAFWMHSLASASLAKRVQFFSTHKRVSSDTTLYLSTLLHDIGVLVSAIYFTSQLRQSQIAAAESGSSYLELERDGVSLVKHCDIGAKLLELWSIDSRIVATARYHHNPAKGPLQMQPVLALISIVSSVMASVNTSYLCYETFTPSLEIFEMAGLSPKILDDLYRIAIEEYHRASSLLASWGYMKGNSIGRIRSVDSSGGFSDTI